MSELHARARTRPSKVEIGRVHREHFAVYGVRKAWRVLNREGIEIARDRVGRLMRTLGLAGATELDGSGRRYRPR